MEFSIIIPMYNTEKYISECLDSVVAQSFNSFECIIVNDGSTDRSVEIASKYCEANNHFRIVSQENRGLSAARNTGLRNAKGDYIVFLDSDDFIKENALYNLHHLILNNNLPDAIVSTTFAYYEKDKNLVLRKWVPQKNSMNRCEALKTTFRDPTFLVAAWTLTCKRSFILDNKLFFKDRLKHEDELWFPQTIAVARTIISNSNAYYCNRCDRKGSITVSSDINKIKDKLYIIGRLSNIVERKDEKIYNEIKYRQAQLYTGIVKDLWRYRMPKDLERQIKSTAYVLKNCDSLKHRLLYIIVKIFNPYNTSKMMRCSFKHLIL